MRGQIVQILSNDYFVNYNNQTIICKVRGKFRLDNITPKVGDYVIFNIETKLITEILPRLNTLERPFVSNISQAFIITSLKQPSFDANLLDKLLVVLYSKKIKPIICLTKKDLLTKEELRALKPIIKYYKKIGIKVIYNTNTFKIKRCFRKKTTVFTGQTGAGKSTLINKLDKSLNFETGEISKALGRGKHTTRYVTLINLYGGKVLDTPGFSSIDLSALTNEEIKNAFKEFAKYPCPYKDCNHINEKICRVKNAVKEKNILQSRYDNYVKFIEKR